MRKKVSIERSEHFHLHGVDFETRTIKIFDSYVTPGEDPESDFSTSEKLTTNLHLLNSENREPITILMNTKGGDAYQMLAMYDAIRLSESKTTIIGCGSVFSSGAMIMQAADWRVLQRECRFMAHIGSGNVDKDFLDITDRYTLTLHNRICEKNKKFPLKQLKKMLRDSEYISAEKALNIGLIDEVL